MLLLRLPAVRVTDHLCSEEEILFDDRLMGAVMAHPLPVEVAVVDRVVKDPVEIGGRELVVQIDLTCADPLVESRLHLHE